MDASALQPIPYCHGMQEHSSASIDRAKLSSLNTSGSFGHGNDCELNPLSLHLSLGLAYTVGSAIGSIPPSTDACLAAFVSPNIVGLTAGARAWSKHAHRSQPHEISPEEARENVESSAGWWGTPSGPVTQINARALELFWKVMNAATWRNLHWLPHRILVYEARVAEGYGMRWSQDRSGVQGNETKVEEPEWIFRGFVEPMMEGGHEAGWRH
ncbi:hypothetical protein B0H17DRAFT_1165878 [Mycena rosella]|uniref:Uncharacterized protein n=1 Tax=Mycena rosella TaxID=1033263 RepID=A0AAD7H0G4_MYCRO|nr:hypothetical protein B0H17DRAFT_1169579 [Mycena rosella]KAJ7709036.1 hypothetical protein B0H17DRAFT_1165878 [Mycena rosella]